MTGRWRAEKYVVAQAWHGAAAAARGPGGVFGVRR